MVGKELEQERRDGDGLQRQRDEYECKKKKGERYLLVAV